MSVIALISILSCVYFVKAASEERVSGVIKSEPETGEIIDHSKISGPEVDGDNFLRTGTEETEDNYKNIEVELVNATDVVRSAINSSTSSFQTQIVSTSDDISGSLSVDVFTNVSTTEDGSLVVEPLNQTSAQDKLRKDKADQDRKLDMSSFENSSVATVSILNHSEPEMGKFGSAARKDLEFDENNILSARNEEENPEKIGVELDKTTEYTKSAINSSTRSSKQRLVSTPDKDDISGTSSVDEFADVSTTEDGSIVVEPLSHTPRVEASAEEKLDMNSLENSTFSTVSLLNYSEPEIDKLGSAESDDLEDDENNLLSTRNEEENPKNTGVGLDDTTEGIRSAVNSSTRSLQTQILSNSNKDDITDTVTVGAFADASASVDGSLALEPLSHIPRDKALVKDTGGQDHKQDMTSKTNPSFVTGALKSSNDTDDALRKDTSFKNDVFESLNSVKSFSKSDDGIMASELNEEAGNIPDEVDNIPINGIEVLPKLEQKRIRNKYIDLGSIRHTVDQDKGGQDHKQDMTSKMNPSFVTGNLNSIENDRVLKSSNDTDDASSKDGTFTNNVFESLNSVSSFSRSDDGIMASDLNEEDKNISDEVENIPKNISDDVVNIPKNIPDEIENIPKNIPDEVENIPINGIEVDLPRLEQKRGRNKYKLMPIENKQTSLTIVNDDGLEDYTRSGEVTTSTVDPIAALLEEVVIVDVNEYLPQGYVLKPEKAVEKEFVEDKKNINELLASEDDKNDIKFKPGKLYGKKLAAIAKEMKETHLHSANDDKIAQQNNNLDMETTESIRGGRILSDGIEFSAEQDSFTVAPITTANPTTTSTPRPTTPGVCGVFCNLAGTLFIRSGLEWSEELSYSFTEEFKEVTNHIVREVSRIFDHVYFGNSFEFATVEAYSRRDGMVLVDIYVQFNDIVFQITTKDVKEAFVDRLVQDDNKNMMGVYEMDITWTYFSVIDTTVPEASMTGTNDVMGIFLPEWSLLAIVVGAISLFVIGFLGVIVCVNRHRNNQLLKKHVLNPRTLELFKSKRHFDTVAVDDATAYANDKRDMWTLQKANQYKRSKNSLSSRPSYVDSGRGSGSGIYSLIPAHIRESFGKSGRKLYEKFPHNRIRSSSVRNHNDSGAGLLEGFDNTRLNSSGVIPENIVDTSFGEDEFGGGVPSQRTRKSVATYQWNNAHARGKQGMYFNDSDSSDAVSDGPSEKL